MQTHVWAGAAWRSAFALGIMIHPVALFHVQRIGDAFADNDLLLARFEMILCVILHK